MKVTEARFDDQWKDDYVKENMAAGKVDYVNCEICGKNDGVILFKAKDNCYDLPGEFKVIRCINCGLVYLNPRPGEKDIGVYYPEEYAPHKTMDGRENVQFEQRLLYLFNRFVGGELRVLWRLTPRKILDVGCGGGNYLKILKDKGWTVYGVDASSIATQRARSLGLSNIFTGELHEARYPNECFDVILMRHSLEHMPHPLETLTEVHRILKQGGTILIVTPNFQSIEARIFKKHWYQIDAPRHFYLFDKSTIGNLLDKQSFRIVSLSFSSRPFSSFSKSLIYSIKNRVFKKLLDNAIFYIIFYVLFWPLHRDTSVVVLAKK